MPWANSRRAASLACDGARLLEPKPSSTGAVARRYPMYVASLDIEGPHYGVRVRANDVTVGNLRAHGCRADGVQVSNIAIREWGDPVNGPIEKPSMTVLNADLRFNGGNGLRVINGGEIRVMAGRVSDNCQMSGYDDPTLSGSAFTRSQGIYYDSTDPDAGPVVAIILGNDVETDNIASYSFPTTGTSYLPRVPEVGGYLTLPDARLNVMAMTFSDLKLVHVGQRFQIQNVDAAGVQDVDVWVRDIIGNAVLVEVSNAYAGAWSDAVQTVPLTGAWTIAAAGIAATSVGGVLWAELPHPAFIKTTGGYVLLENALSTDTFNIQDDATWGASFERTLTGAITAGAISYLRTGFSYTMRQTVRAQIIHANVATARDNLIDLTTGAMSAVVYDIRITGFLNLGPAVNKTIAAGVITATSTRITLGTEGGAATDDLNTILGGTDGDIILLATATAGNDVTLKTRVGGADNLRLVGGIDQVLNHSYDKIMLIYRLSDACWHQISPLADLAS